MGEVAYPQHGGCLCGDVRYDLAEDPLTLYACHCTDCQRQSGSSFALSMIVREAALRIAKGDTAEHDIAMPDGRRKHARFCGRCCTRLWGISSVPGLAVLEPGTLDDTSWLHPVGHIWTRSAQPWVVIPAGRLRYEAQPDREQQLELVRAWKARQG